MWLGMAAEKNKIINLILSLSVFNAGSIDSWWQTVDGTVNSHERNIYIFEVYNLDSEYAAQKWHTHKHLKRIAIKYGPVVQCTNPATFGM